MTANKWDLMKIVDANSLRDGGTVEIIAKEDGAITRFVLDFSLPWDGRPRQISVWRSSEDNYTPHWSSSEDGEKRTVPVGSDEETEICSRIRGCLEVEYGHATVDDALKNSPARKQAWDAFLTSQEGLFVNPAEFEDPYPLPFDGIWLNVFNFIEKAYREGKLSELK